MPCKCKKKDQIAAPDETCMICIQKHFLNAWGALREFRHAETNDNRDYAISELGLAIDHAAESIPALADMIRAIRLDVQYRKPVPREKWNEARTIINTELDNELNQQKDPAVPEIPAAIFSPASEMMRELEKWKIYVFSNVKYPEKNRLDVNRNDLLIFLNKAETIAFYKDHPRKIVYHRSPKDSYGKKVPGCKNFYVFDDPEKIPADFIDGLKKEYDWNYPIEEGKVRCMTTGYMVIKWLEKLFPRQKIILVNFGYSVKKSTYRCPWHNWEYEATQLQKFPHIYLEEEPIDEVKK